MDSLIRGIDHARPFQFRDNLVAKPFLFVGSLDKHILVKKHYENEAKIKLEICLLCVPVNLIVSNFY